MISKRILFGTLLSVVGISAYSQNIGINSTGAAADASAALDVSTSNKGVLLPRVALTGTNDVTTVSLPATSLLVYNTASVSDVTPGYYYYNGTVWVKLTDSGSNADADWYKVGTSSSPANINDDIFTQGRVGIGTAIPVEKLHVIGSEIIESWDAVLKTKGPTHDSVYHLIGTYQGWDNTGVYIAGYNYYNPQGGNVINSYAKKVHIGHPERLTIDLQTGNTGIGTTTPNNSALLDMYSSNKGFLPPRVALTGVNDVATIPSPATGLLVYNTANAGSGSNLVYAGYYYFDGSFWRRLGETNKKEIVANVFSAGYGVSSAAGDRCVYVNGVQVSCSSRGATLTVISGTNGNVIFSQSYDLYGGGFIQHDNLATAINSYNNGGNILIVNTYDAPSIAGSNVLSSNLKTALREVMQSKRIVDEGADYFRGAWCIAFQNGKGKLGEDICNSNTTTGITTHGNTTRATAAINFITYIGL